MSSAMHDLQVTAAQVVADVKDAIEVLQWLQQRFGGTAEAVPSTRIVPTGEAVPASEVQAMVSHMHDLHANLSGVVKAARAQFGAPMRKDVTQHMPPQSFERAAPVDSPKDSPADDSKKK